jgi:hypothetical protein
LFAPNEDQIEIIKRELFNPDKYTIPSEVNLDKLMSNKNKVKKALDTRRKLDKNLTKNLSEDQLLAAVRNKRKKKTKAAAAKALRKTTLDLQLGLIEDHTKLGEGVHRTLTSWARLLDTGRTLVCETNNCRCTESDNEECEECEDDPAYARRRSGCEDQFCEDFDAAKALLTTMAANEHIISTNKHAAKDSRLKYTEIMRRRGRGRGRGRRSLSRRVVVE